MSRRCDFGLTHSSGRGFVKHQVIEGDRVVCTHHQRTQHHVFKFAHIAGPAVGLQRRLGLGVDAEHAVCGCMPCQQTSHERQNVARSIAQRRHAQLESADTKVKVFTELARHNRCAKVFVGSHHNAYIKVDGAVATQTDNLALLQYAQQLGLQIQRHFTDFI